MLLRSVLILAACGVAACAVPRSRSNMVVVTDNKAIVESCTRIGEINGDSAMGAILLRDSARDSALARLKASAAEQDGTHVLSGVATTSWKGPSTAGTLYKCANADPVKPG